MNGAKTGWLICTILAASGGVCSAQQTASWLNAADGLWSDGANWSGGVVPNDVGGNTFVADISIAGSYQVSVDIDVALSGLAMTGAGAEMQFTGANLSLSTTGNNVLQGARITGDAGTTITADGDTVMSGGALIVNVSGFRFDGNVDFVDDDDFELCDTCLDIRGSGQWSGGGSFNLQGVMGSSELVVGAGASLTVSGVGSRQVNGAGVTNSFINRGTLSVELDSAVDSLQVKSAFLINEAGGEVRVSRGTLESNAIGSALQGRLRGGDWFVGDQGTVDFVGTNILEIEVGVELDGAGSSFAAVDSLETVLAGGVFAVGGGRDFTTAAAANIFDVQGGLEVGAGSSFSVSTTLANIDGSALRGGRFVVGGELELASGDITTLGADLVLDGAGAIMSAAGGANLLDNLDEIEAAGTMELTGGADFTTTGDLTLDGELKVASGSAFEVTGDVSAFQAGTFAGAAIEVGGDVKADNTRLERVEGRLVVGRDGQLLMASGGGTVDGLMFLQRVEAAGVFGLRGGRVLDLDPMDNTVEVAGTLVLGTSGLEGPGNTGSMLIADGYVQEVGSGLRIGIASTADFGRVVSDSLTFGLGSPGDTAGELTLVLDSTYAALLGDEFLIFETPSLASIFGAGFSLISVEGVLGGGLFFEQFLGESGMGVRVVPAPGAGAGLVLLSGLVAVRRRRA